MPLPSSCWRLVSFFCAPVLSQSPCNRTLYLPVSPLATWIAFAAFLSSFSTSSKSTSVRRISSPKAALFWRKSVPSDRIRSSNGRKTSRSRRSHWRVVRRTQIPSSCDQRHSRSVCRNGFLPPRLHCSGGSPYLQTASVRATGARHRGRAEATGVWYAEPKSHLPATSGTRGQFAETDFFPQGCIVLEEVLGEEILFGKLTASAETDFFPQGCIVLEEVRTFRPHPFEQR